MQIDKDVAAIHIKEYLIQQHPEGAALLQHDTLLLEEWFIDSMEIITMVLFLEKQFGIRMGPADVSATNFQTLATLATFVAAKTASHVTCQAS